MRLGRDRGRRRAGRSDRRHRASPLTASRCSSSKSTIGSVIPSTAPASSASTPSPNSIFPATHLHHHECAGEIPWPSRALRAGRGGEVAAAVVDRGRSIVGLADRAARAGAVDRARRPRPGHSRRCRGRHRAGQVRGRSARDRRAACASSHVARNTGSTASSVWASRAYLQTAQIETEFPASPRSRSISTEPWRRAASRGSCRSAAKEPPWPASGSGHPTARRPASGTISAGSLPGTAWRRPLSAAPEAAAAGPRQTHLRGSRSRGGRCRRPCQADDRGRDSLQPPQWTAGGRSPRVCAERGSH